METVNSYRTACTNLQSQLIETQQTLISVQKELSECKSEKRESKKVVETSVADSVKEEFKSYSSVVGNSQPAAAPVISRESVKLLKPL